jgi:PAS domain S-box-containing protein
MTIRRRLTLSFVTILALFALNLVIYFWGNHRRQSAVEDLRRAMRRQLLSSSIHQKLDNSQKQVSLLSQEVADPGGGGARAEEVEQFKAQLAGVTSQAGELRDLSNAAERVSVDDLVIAANKLIASWTAFYENAGVNQSAAIAELAIRADPISQEVLRQILPKLEKEEEERVVAAGAGFYRVARITDLLTVLIFFASTMVAIAVAYSLSRHLTFGLRQLKQGAESIGGGNLEQLIPLDGDDELTDLARAFNKMTGSLYTARTELTRARELEDDILQSMADSLVVLDSERRIRTANPATHTLLGYGEGSLIGEPIGRIAAETELFNTTTLARLDSSSSIESEYIARDGRRIPVRIALASMRGGGDRVICMAQDGRERKRAERELLKAKESAETANRAKSELLSRTSHELRTPLNAILGFGQLLEISELGEDDRESVDRMMKAGRHLLRLINEVLDIAGIEGRRTLSKEPIQIGCAAHESLDLVRTLAETHNIELRAEFGSCEDAYVLADNQRLQQVLLNLLSNAIKYNREGGMVTLSCEPRPGENLRISVGDTGQGISPEGLAKLFVPFERLGAAESGIEGTGLGLSSSKIFVEAMGGSIGVDSVVGEGTAFWLDLPLAEAPLDELEPEPDSPSGGIHLKECGARTVLYIEDNVSNFELVERILLRYPWLTLLSALQGEQGVQLARERRPDLILLDLHLPDIWGDEVLRRLRADPATAGIPVVMLSADATSEQINRLLAAGAQGYLTKPIDFQKLLKILGETLKNETLANV